MKEQNEAKKYVDILRKYVEHNYHHAAEIDIKRQRLEKWYNKLTWFQKLFVPEVPCPIVNTRKIHLWSRSDELAGFLKADFLTEEFVELLKKKINE